MKVDGKHYRSLWADEALGVVHIIDQARLPHAFETRTLASAEAVAEAIRTMRVRGTRALAREMRRKRLARFMQGAS